MVLGLRTAIASGNRGSRCPPRLRGDIVTALDTGVILAVLGVLAAAAYVTAMVALVFGRRR